MRRGLIEQYPHLHFCAQSFILCLGEERRCDDLFCHESQNGFSGGNGGVFLLF